MRTRLITIMLPIFLSAVAFRFAGCGGNSASDGNSSDEKYSGHPLVGSWFQQQITYHYQGLDDVFEQPADSTWFRFDASGGAVFTQAVPGGIHQQLYLWTVTDSALTLTSDIELNTGVFEYTAGDSVFTCSRVLTEASRDGLTGWTYRYIRVSE